MHSYTFAMLSKAIKQAAVWYEAKKAELAAAEVYDAQHAEALHAAPSKMGPVDRGREAKRATLEAKADYDAAVAYAAYQLHLLQIYKSALRADANEKEHDNAE